MSLGWLWILLIVGTVFKMNIQKIKIFNFFSSVITVINYIIYSISFRFNFNFFLTLLFLLAITNIVLNFLFLYESKKNNLLNNRILFNFILTIMINIGLLFLWFDLK